MGGTSTLATQSTSTGLGNSPSITPRDVCSTRDVTPKLTPRTLTPRDVVQRDEKSLRSAQVQIARRSSLQALSQLPPTGIEAAYGSNVGSASILGGGPLITGGAVQ